MHAATAGKNLSVDMLYIERSFPSQGAYSLPIPHELECYNYASLFNAQEQKEFLLSKVQIGLAFLNKETKKLVSFSYGFSALIPAATIQLEAGAGIIFNCDIVFCFFWLFLSTFVKDGAISSDVWLNSTQKTGATLRMPVTRSPQAMPAITNSCCWCAMARRAHRSTWKCSPCRSKWCGLLRGELLSNSCTHSLRRPRNQHCISSSSSSSARARSRRRPMRFYGRHRCARASRASRQQQQQPLTISCPRFPRASRRL